MKIEAKGVENIDLIKRFVVMGISKIGTIIAKRIGLSPVRTRVILANMPELEALGGNRNRTYHLKEKRK